MIRYHEAWWNRRTILRTAYLTWPITPLLLASVAISKFVNGEYPARAVLREVAELVNEHPLLSTAWEAGIGLVCSVVFLQLFVSRKNGFHKFRKWSAEHPGKTLVITALLVFIAQVVLLNWGTKLRE